MKTRALVYVIDQRNVDTVEGVCNGFFALYTVFRVP